MIKFLLLSLLIALNLNANITTKDFDNFFKLQKLPDTLINKIKKINLIYKLGYPEKAKQKLYILLDGQDKASLKETLKTLKKNMDKDFDESTLNTIDFLLTSQKKQPLDKEILNIFNEKNNKETLKTEKNNPPNQEKSKTTKANSKTKKEHKNKHAEFKLPQKIETAIVLSEWLDDLDIENSLNYISLLNSKDVFFEVTYEYLLYLKDKNPEALKKLNKKSPLYYHIMISIYKNTDKAKAKEYFEKIKKEFPKYLKYNRIDL